MNSKQRIIDLFPIPTFLFQKKNSGIIYCNQKGLILTQLNEQSIKSKKISDFIDKEFLTVGEFKNCCFKINNHPFFIGSLSVKTLDKNCLIASFWSYSKVSESSYNVNVSEEDSRNKNLYVTRAFIDLSPDSILVIEDGIIKYANSKLLTTSGYKQCDLIGKRFTEFVWAKEIKKIHSIFTTKEKEEKVSIEFESKAKLADGKLIEVKVSVIDISFEGVPAYQVSLRDITKSKIAEEKLYKLTASIEQSPLCIVITDLQGTIEYVNPHFSKLTGYKKEELIGNNPRILNSGIQSKAFYKELWDTVLSGNKWEGEICNKKKNGELYWEFATISPLKDISGQIINLVGIKENITERKRMVEELVHAKEKAEESDRLKSAFLANMSHEIRTPMNGILGFTDLLLEPNLDNETKDEFIKIIHQCGQRMLDTVNDLVEISKIEAGVVKIKRSPINIYQCVNSLICFFEMQAKQKGLTLIFDVGLSLQELVVLTDRRKLESILVNLIKNAIKFTDKGSITVDYIVDDNFVEFSIKDTGIGISKQNLSVIFNRFQQADNGESRAFEGSGLGLTITKSYVEMLGGKIWAETVIKKGSTFYFTIPFKL